MQNPAIVGAIAELPAQFNAAYLSMLAWLGRMYEVQDWMEDRPRRMAVEMLAAWPLMSLAIRPFLELASCLPVDISKLFRLECNALPDLPVHAQQLHALYRSKERSEKTNREMDYFVIHALSDVASWARRQANTFEDAELPLHEKQLILYRFKALGQLDEFEKQYPFRVHGGYSARLPDVGYQQRHPDSRRYEEDPTAVSPIFKDTLALKLRFSGWELVQLATDPDPPTDEVGCTGTIMLHAADGDRRLDRAIVWQNDEPEHNIVRGPPTSLPQVGVQCVDVSLVVGSVVNAGFAPLQVIQSVGAVQAGGVQQDMVVTGFKPLVQVQAKEVVGEGRSIRCSLLPKDGVRPFFNGQNHLVFQDGEPVDPFIFSVSADTARGAQLIFQREVFNQGVSMLQMMPLERIGSARAPCGFDFDLSHVPEWAKANVGPMQRALVDGDVPVPVYLVQRCTVLTKELATAISKGTSQEDVDATISCAERLFNFALPKGTTVGWLAVLLHYGHTVSGQMMAGSTDNPLFATIRYKTGLSIRLPDAKERSEANSRWLVGYTNGVMDTDAMANFVYGELYVPIACILTEDPLTVNSTWTFPADVKVALISYACDFARPFWAPYDVHGNARTLRLTDKIVLTETLTSATNHKYTYALAGLSNVSEYVGQFDIADDKVNKVCRLVWTVSFRAATEAAVVNALSVTATGSQQMQSALAQHFAPHLDVNYG